MMYVIIHKWNSTDFIYKAVQSLQVLGCTTAYVIKLYEAFCGSWVKELSLEATLVSGAEDYKFKKVSSEVRLTDLCSLLLTSAWG